MKAMLLAAGRGARMRSLTDHTAKPLLTVNGVSLIDYHLYKLAKAGIRDIVINVCWQANKVTQHIGDGAKYGLNIVFSHETHALETAGGVAKALAMLGTDPFILISSDCWTDLDYTNLSSPAEHDLAHLIVVNNPPHHSSGDFALENGRLTRSAGTHALTYSGIGIYRPQLFEDARNKTMPLRDVLFPAIERKQVSASFFPGTWMDIGTPERLDELRELLKNNAGVNH